MAAMHRLLKHTDFGCAIAQYRRLPPLGTVEPASWYAIDE